MHKDKQKIHQLFVHDEFSSTIKTFKQPQIDEHKLLQAYSVFNESSWNDLQLFLFVINLLFAAMREHRRIKRSIRIRKECKEAAKAIAMSSRQWPKVSDFVVRFCTLHAILA